MLCFLMDLHLFSLYACVWCIYKLIFVVFLWSKEFIECTSKSCVNGNTFCVTYSHQYKKCYSIKIASTKLLIIDVICVSLWGNSASSSPLKISRDVCGSDLTRVYRIECFKPWLSKSPTYLQVQNTVSLTKTHYQKLQSFKTT